MSDPFYDFTTALLSFEPDPRWPDVQIVDRSFLRGSWVAVGDPLSTDWSKFGANSLRASAPLTYAYRDDIPAIGRFGSFDFCIEAWVNLEADQPADRPCIFTPLVNPSFEWGPNSFGIYFDRTDDTLPGRLTFRAYNSNPEKLLQSTTIVAGAGPLHFAVSRQGSTWRLFINGQQESTASWGGALNDLTLLYAPTLMSEGRPPFSNTTARGYIDEFRITVGVARYTSNFTPQSEPFYAPTINGNVVGSRLVQQLPIGTIPVRPIARDIGVPIARRDIYFAGDGVIYGTVKEQGAPANVPLRRKVLLLDETTNIIMRETWSDAVTGAYSFASIDRSRRYTVITYDYLRNYRAVIADNLVASVAA